MNLAYLLTCHTDEEIIKRLGELYPDQKKSKEGYQKVLTLLRKKRAKKDEYQIHIELVTNDNEDDDWESYISVGGRKEGDDISYAIEFDRWSLWLGRDFTVESLMYSGLDMICHCLWEMTFFGFNEQKLYRTRRMLNDRVQDINKQLLEEKNETA